MAEESRSLSALLALLATTLLLAGCPSLSTRPEAPSSTGNAPPPSRAPSATSPAQPPPPAERPLPTPRENHLSPATRSLVNQAHAMLGRGDLDGASATLDRALRIEPNNPL